MLEYCNLQYSHILLYITCVCDIYLWNMPILGLQTLAPSLQSVTPGWPPAMAPTYWRSLIYLLLNSSYSGRKLTQFSVSQSSVLCYCFDSMYCRCLFNSSLWRTEVRWRTGGRALVAARCISVPLPVSEARRGLTSTEETRAGVWGQGSSEFRGFHL